MRDNQDSRVKFVFVCVVSDQCFAFKIYPSTLFILSLLSNSLFWMEDEPIWIFDRSRRAKLVQK